MVDYQIDRTNVNKETADHLRKRMADCKSLFYASTENTTESKWMPWETGFFDAKKEKVAIVPIRNYDQPDDKYTGQEYLGLYPYISLNRPPNGHARLYVNENPSTYVTFDAWLKGEKPSKH